MSIEAILKHLDDFSIFGSIEEEQLMQLSDLFESRSYSAGEKIIVEGTRGNRFYIVASGEVEISMNPKSRNGNLATTGNGPIPLALLRRGETFGEMAIIDTQQRSASVTALEPTETLELTNMALLRIYERSPDSFRALMMNLARDLSRRLRATEKRLAVYVETGTLPPPDAGSSDRIDP